MSLQQGVPQLDRPSEASSAPVHGPSESSALQAGQQAEQAAPNTAHEASAFPNAQHRQVWCCLPLVPEAVQLCIALSH